MRVVQGRPVPPEHEHDVLGLLSRNLQPGWCHRVHSLSFQFRVTHRGCAGRLQVPGRLQLCLGGARPGGVRPMPEGHVLPHAERERLHGLQPRHVCHWRTSTVLQPVRSRNLLVWSRGQRLHRMPDRILRGAGGHDPMPVVREGPVRHGDGPCRVPAVPGRGVCGWSGNYAVHSLPARLVFRGVAGHSMPILPCGVVHGAGGRHGVHRMSSRKLLDAGGPC